MGVGGALGGWGAVLAVEVCAPVLLLCWLCCWPDDSNSESSSGTHPSKPVVTHESRPGARHRSNELFGARFGSSAVSLHLPSTSGIKVPLSAHRSHEEIRSRRKSQLEPTTDETRYHSAPSIIDEVVHRRDWDTSTRELYIPLKPDRESITTSDPPETDEQIVARSCKKHYTNIKSSRKKESDTDIKDTDMTEVSSFYIGDNLDTLNVDSNDIIVKQIHRPKETKQSLNESIKSKDRVKKTLVPVEEFKVSRFVDSVEVEVDRSGAVHHSVESRSSVCNPQPPPVPAPSVAAVGYDIDTTYLEETSRAVPPVDKWSLATAPVSWLRARHASAGDVLAPVLRPQSGALSESDLDFDLEGCDEPPPAYHELEHFPTTRKETAI